MPAIWRQNVFCETEAIQNHYSAGELERQINNLQSFLLELGEGCGFVARQERTALDGDSFYIDLVFYHTNLKSYALIELNIRKLTLEDLDQLELNVNYYDQHCRTTSDNPKLGLILCTDKNVVVIRHTLEPGRKNIFASRYKLHLPSKAAWHAELRRELEHLRA